MAVAAGVPEALAVVEPFRQDLSVALPIIQGNEYERLRLAQLAESMPEGSFIELPARGTEAQAKAAMDTGFAVIAQACLSAEYGSVGLRGYADLLVREDYELFFDELGRLSARPIAGAPSLTGDAKYAVWDIKHSKRFASSGAKLKEKTNPHYVNQIATYFEILQGMGRAANRPIGLVYRSTELAEYEGQPALDTLVAARTPMLEHLEQNPPASVTSIVGLDLHCPSESVCKEIHCDYPDLCAAERVRLDDLSQLYIYNHTHLRALRAAGLDTVAKVADSASGLAVPKLSPEYVEKYQAWAKVITAEKQTGVAQYEVIVKPSQSEVPLPKPSEGDIFFDLEWFNAVNSDYALHYLFGSSDRAGKFVPLLAANQEEEKQRLIEFVTLALARIEEHPSAHVFHISNPEQSNLRAMAKRHGVMQAEVDRLLPSMFDLLNTARASIVVGAGGFGIKKLERYYNTEAEAETETETYSETDDSLTFARDTETTDGASSMVQYQSYLEAVGAGETRRAQAILQDIIKYNRADCVSTLKLYNWLETFG